MFFLKEKENAEEPDAYQCPKLKRYGEKREQCGLMHQQIYWILRNRGDESDEQEPTPPANEQNEEEGAYLKEESVIVLDDNDLNHVITVRQVSGLQNNILHGSYCHPVFGFSIKAVTKRFDCPVGGSNEKLQQLSKLFQ